MSIRLMTLIWDTDLPAKEKLLLLCLADYANDDGENVYPAVETMAKRSSIPTRTVYRTLASLKKQKLLIPVERRGPYASVRYRVNRTAIVARLAHLRPATTDIQTCHIGQSEVPKLGTQSTIEPPENPSAAKPKIGTLIGGARDGYSVRIADKPESDLIQDGHHYVLRELDGDVAVYEFAGAVE